MQGQDLYKILFDSLDLPEHIKVSYLEGVMKKYAVSSDELTVEMLREIVADLLQETILAMDSGAEPTAAIN